MTENLEQMYLLRYCLVIFAEVNGAINGTDFRLAHNSIKKHTQFHFTLKKV